MMKGRALGITVRELMQLPHLRAALLAGESGLDQPVTWVHTSDLPNAWEWHGSGELLLTNGTGLSSLPREQADFASRLADTGASGLAIGLGMPSPPVSRRLRECADSLGLPLLTVPFSVPFTAVVRAVADANEREESRQVLQVARLYELLRQSIEAGSEGPSLLQRLGRELGVRLYLVDPTTGQSLLDGEETRYAQAVAQGYAAHGNALPGMLRLTERGEDDGIGALAVAVPAAYPTALVVESDSQHLPSTVLLQHAAAGGALELAQLTARQERQLRAGTDLFIRLLERRVDARTANRELAAFDLSIAECVVVVARAGSDAADGLGHSLVRRHQPHLLLGHDERVHVLVSEEALSVSGTADWVSTLPAVGVSDVVGSPARMPEAVEEASWALAAAVAEGVDRVRYGHEALLLPRTPTEARSIVRRVLGPLLAHDATTGGDFVETLRVLLEHDRSWQAAAEVLHIHKQTLGYRLRRIEALTGRGFSSTEHLAEWWVALRAHHMLEGAAGAGAGPVRPIPSTTHGPPR